jgi:hypothetical protein
MSAHGNSTSSDEVRDFAGLPATAQDNPNGLARSMPLAKEITMIDDDC